MHRARAQGCGVALALALVLVAGSGSSVHAADDGPALGWAGEIALGGSLATGNTDRQALDLESKAQFRTEHREDRYKLLGDLARENGVVTAERTEVSAQSNYDLAKDKFYLIAFTQLRRDTFSGFSYEAEVGPGIGYRFVRTNKLTFAVEFSTGYRHGELIGAGNDDDLIFARGTATVEYQLSDNAKFANETLITGDNQRLKLEDTLSVTSTIVRGIAMRASINARYNTDPPGTIVKKVDTLSKISVVYGF